MTALLEKDITINGQSYHIVGRTQDELAQEARRMEQEYRVPVEEVQQAWDALQAVPAYVERKQS